MSNQADLLWADLGAAIGRRIQHTAKRRRRQRLAAVSTVVVGAVTTSAIASGIASDLHLAPSDWAVLRDGSIDNGRGSYVHARRLADGTSSTFLAEHDDGLTPYEAFLLHERTLAAANATSPTAVREEPGSLCTRDQLTHAEKVSLSALAANFAPGTGFDASGAIVSDALEVAFADQPCRGLAFAGEEARHVFAGTEPATMLMPGAR